MRFKLNLRETWNRQYRIICEKEIATANGNNLHCIIPLESLKWKILKKNSSMYIHIQKLNRASSDRVMNNFQKDRTGNALEKQKWITPAITIGRNIRFIDFLWALISNTLTYLMLITSFRSVHYILKQIIQNTRNLWSCREHTWEIS